MKILFALGKRNECTLCNLGLT